MKIKKIVLASACVTMLFASCQEEDELTVKSPSAVISPIDVTPVTPVISTTVSLYSVKLYLSKSSGLTGTVTARIVEVSSGRLKGESTINVSKINNYVPKWTTFAFGGVSLRKGTLHRIEIICSDQSDAGDLSWYADADNYANGSMGVNESNMTFNDLCFATYYKKGTSVQIGQQSRANDRGSYVVNISDLVYWQEFKTEPLIRIPS